MDPLKADITFLDLTGVDDEEREKVLNSLYEDSTSVKLPWKTAEKKMQQKTAFSSHTDHFQPNCNYATQQDVYVSNEVSCTTYLSQPNTYQTPMAPSAYPIPQYVIYTNYHPQYPIPVVSTNMTYTPEVNCERINYTNTITQEHHNSNFQVDEHKTSVSEPTLPVTAESGSEEVKVDTVQNEEVSEPISINGVSENQQNGLGKDSNVEKTSPAPVNKSWASLFSSTKTSTSVNIENGGNPNVKSFSNEAVKESNNDNELCPIKYPRKTQFIDPNCYRMGEFLLGHSVDGRTISLQPRGLINRSNYCYINSILQALLACPPVYNLLSGLAEQNVSAEKDKATPIIDAMCRFVKEFHHLPAGLRVNRRNEKNQKKEQGLHIDCETPFEPSWIYKMLSGIRSDSFLVEGRQEDAEEFLGCLLNGLNDEMLELMKLVKSDLAVNKFDSESGTQDESSKEWQVMGPKNKGSITRQFEFIKTPISNIFGGFLKSRIHRTGDHSTYNIQPFFTLQLNIEKVKTVREALETLVSKNQLEGFTSEKTNEEVEAWQQVTLEELPVILILHLKCFDFKLDGCTKIVKALEFPIDLKIDSKLLSSKTNTPKEKQYKLFAVVYHDGKEATKGHYITDAFHVGYSSWIRYDDASVKSVQEDNVLKPQGTRVPYLLFYRRSDTIRANKST